MGDFTLSGNTFFIDSTRLQIEDPLIYLASNNYVDDIVDIGFIGHYVNATGYNVHTGLYREHEDKQYYLFQGYDQEPRNNHIGAFSNNMTLAVLNADLKTSNLILGGANAITWIEGAFKQANDSYVYANSVVGSSFGQANTAYSRANTALDIADSAFDQANAAYGRANVALDIADSSFDQANAAYGRANVSLDIANSAYGQANAAYNQANVTLNITEEAFDQANSSYGRANLALDIADSAFDQANAGYNRANTALDIADSSFDQANAAYSRANTGLTVANSAYGHANASYDIAIAAFLKANTGNSGGGGGGNTTYNIRTVAGDTTLTDNDNLLLVDGSANVTLPNAVLSLSKAFEIKNINTGTITIVGTDSQLIDGNANLVIQYKNSTLGVRSVGSSWIVF